MLRLGLLAVLFAGFSPAADHWTEYRSGPFHVISDAGDRSARELLNNLEQLRFSLGAILGKNELDTVWPVDIALFQNAREYGPYSLPSPLVPGGSATLAAWSADTPAPRDLLCAVTRLLIEDNAGRMPDSIEAAICDVFSTIKVNGTHVSLGAPLPDGDLPAERMRAWSRMQLLITGPEYSGKIRVYLGNLQQGGDEDAAVRNAFDTTVAKLNARAEEYRAAGNFEAAPVNGRALNPTRDFIEKSLDAGTAAALLAELKSGGKSFPPDSPRGLEAKGTLASLELAAKANPKWAEPHAQLAALQTEPLAKVREWKAAATLEPRNSGYWQSLATAQADANQYADAERSWVAAEKAAPNDAERQSIHQEHTGLLERRAAFEESEKARIADEKAKELQRIKDAAAAEVHAAEAASNARLGNRPLPERVVPWWDDPKGEKLSGALTRVDCLGASSKAASSTSAILRLTIQKDGGGTIRLLIRDLSLLSMKGEKEVSFSCGIERPARKIRLVYGLRADAKNDTVGDVLVVEFP